jgi:hypothetical protein
MKSRRQVDLDPFGKDPGRAAARPRTEPVRWGEVAMFYAGIGLLPLALILAVVLLVYLLRPSTHGAGMAQAGRLPRGDGTVRSAPAPGAAATPAEQCFDADGPGVRTLLSTFRFFDADGVDIADNPARRRRLLCDPNYRPHILFAGLLWISPDGEGRDREPFLVGPEREKPLSFLSRRVDSIRFLDRGSPGCAGPDVGAFYTSRPKAINICSPFGREGVLWLPMLMHEARHADGKHHVPCRYGPVVRRAGCDASFAEYGAFRVSFEVARDLSRSRELTQWVRRAAADLASRVLLANFKSLAPEFALKSGAYVVSGGRIFFFNGERLEDLGGMAGVYLARARARPPGGELIVAFDQEDAKAVASTDGRSFHEAAPADAVDARAQLDMTFGLDRSGEDVWCRLERRRFSCTTSQAPAERLSLDLPFESAHLLFKGDPQIAMEQLPAGFGVTPASPMVESWLAGKRPGACFALISSTAGEVYAVQRESGDAGPLVAEKIESGHGILAAATLMVEGRARTLLLRTDRRVHVYDDHGNAGSLPFDGLEVDDLLAPEVWTDALGK